MMQSKIKDLEPAQSQDNNILLQEDVYNHALVGIKKDLKKLNFEGRRINTVMYRDFRRIINLYFYYAIVDLIDGLSFNFHNKVGRMRIVKYLYNKKYLRGFRRYKQVFGDYMYYVHWDKPKMFKNTRFQLSDLYVKKMMHRIHRGFDYIDYTD